MDTDRIKIAYFSMEVGINSSIHSYSGGLGILAGDMLRSCADLELPVIGITLLYKKGFFKQRIENGEQREEEQSWDPSQFLEKLPNKVCIKIGGQDVHITAWLYKFEGITGTKNPLLFLDTDLEENSEENRRITDALYQGDNKHRLVQEMVLGIGGVQMLKSIGYNLNKYHMNEGHASFLTLALCKDISSVEEIRKKCIFTTHTPVPAGHDKFEKNMAMELLKEYIPQNMDVPALNEDPVNMTRLGLHFSAYVNGVSRKHRDVSQEMFPKYDLKSITNGIHQGFWVCEPFKNLFDREIFEWKKNPYSLRSVLHVSDGDIWNAHIEAKKKLIEEINKTGANFDVNCFTIGYARRFAKYKRPDMILYNIDELKQIAENSGCIQIVFAGKAHPNDGEGKDLIKKVFNEINNLKDKVKVCFLENYNIDIGKLMTSGCDVWLNNPKRPLEASGTSGMKAAINGVPNFSTLDGWWLEGHIENVTGWSIGLHPNDPGFNEDESPDDEAADFYKKLREVVLPIYYNDRNKWISIMKHSIALNGSFFNTHRMVQEYVLNAYFR